MTESGIAPIARILAPTDFSDCADDALDHALAIASWFDAKVTVIHVVPQTFMQPELFPYLDEPVVLPAEIREKAERRLEEHVARFSGRGVTPESRLESGEAAKRILRRAEELPADLVVLGTHGRGGFTEWLLGSVAERVLRKAPCAVLTVGRPYRSCRDVLAAVDFSENSIDGLDLARAIAAQSGAALSVIHVAEKGTDSSAVWLRLQEVAGANVEIVVEERDSPHAAICRVAAERDSDLIVAGTTGAGGIEPLLLGSTAAQLVRTAPCPVLAVPRIFTKEA